MSRSIVFAFILAACGSDAPPKPYTGKLTIDRVKSLTMRSLSLCADTWDVALAKVEGKLGKPTKIDGKDFTWAAVEGERCAIVSVERGECPPSWNKPGPRLASSTEPVETTPTSKGPVDHEDCVAVAGGATAK